MDNQYKLNTKTKLLNDKENELKEFEVDLLKREIQLKLRENTILDDTQKLSELKKDVNQLSGDLYIYILFIHKIKVNIEYICTENRCF